MKLTFGCAQSARFIVISPSSLSLSLSRALRRFVVSFLMHHACLSTCVVLLCVHCCKYGGRFCRVACRAMRYSRAATFRCIPVVRVAAHQDNGSVCTRHNWTAHSSRLMTTAANVSQCPLSSATHCPSTTAGRRTEKKHCREYALMVA